MSEPVLISPPLPRARTCSGRQPAVKRFPSMSDSLFRGAFSNPLVARQFLDRLAAEGVPRFD